ncbi:MAG: nucleotide pyrophosphohydrolase [Chlamydia sp.]
MSADIQRILEMHKKFTHDRGWDCSQTPKNLSMALSVEVSELMEIFMWISEQQSFSLDSFQRHAAADEVADIFIYLIRIASVLGVDIIKSAEAKMKKNFLRFPIENEPVLF